MSGIILETIDCPLCGDPRSAPVVTCEDYVYHIAGTFHFVRCQGCRHVYLNPCPNLETISECYPKSYVPHDFPSGSQSEPQSRPPKFQLVLRKIPGLRQLYYWLIDDHSMPVPPCPNSEARALEIGCATGNYLWSLKQAGWHVTGLEPAEQAANVANARGLPVHCGTLDTVTFDSETYDAVFAWMVLEHVHHPIDTLRAIAELLKPGGRLNLSVPNFGCWEPSLFGRYWLGYDSPRHLHQFTPQSLRRLLEQCGYSQVRIRHQSNIRYVYGSLGAWRCARNPSSQLGKKLLHYFLTNPPMWFHLATCVPGKILAGLRQGGRMTISAVRK